MNLRQDIVCAEARFDDPRSCHVDVTFERESRALARPARGSHGFVRRARESVLLHPSIYMTAKV